MARAFNGHRRGGNREALHGFATRACIIASIAALGVVFLWFAHKAVDVVLLTFAGIFMAVLLHSLAAPLARRTGWPIWVAVLVVVTVSLGLLAYLGWLIAPSVSEQFDQLIVQLPESVNRLQSHLHEHKWYNWLIAQGAADGSSRKLLGQVPKVFTVTAGVIAGVVIIGFLAIYMAAAPRIYVDGVVRLMPVSFRPRAREVLAELYRTLRVWIMTKLITMAFTGVAVGIGLWLLKAPLPLAMGIVAGLLEFIPTIGPLVSAVPAILLALLVGPITALYVAILYFAVQWIGNHVTTPLLQQKMLRIPAAVHLVLVVMLAAMFGFAGALLSGPLSIVIVVLVKMLYVEDVLERRARRRVEHTRGPAEVHDGRGHD